MQGVELAPVDLALLALLGLALLRGALRGLLLEAFSLGSIAVAVIAVRALASPFGRWLQHASEARIAEWLAPWLAGALLALTAIALTTALGRFLRSSARAVGLGWADRAGGALLGAAEGALVVAAVLAVLGRLLGSGHDSLEGSLTAQILRRFERPAPLAREAAAPVPRLSPARPSGPRSE